MASYDKAVSYVIENNSIALAQMFTNKKPQLNYVLSCNENGSNDRSDNFKNDRVSLLHAAAFHNSLESFCFLVTKYKNNKEHNVLRLKSAKSYFPLHYACFNGSREIVAYILSEDPEQASLIPPDIDHHFLFFAVYGGDPIILTELFKNGADLEERHNVSDNPIGKAITLSQIECLKVLLKYEKRSINQDYYTPAMLASKNCHPDALKLLITGEDDITYFSPSNQSVISLMFYYSNGLLFKDVLIDLLRKYPDVRIEPPDSVTTIGVCHWICKIADKDVALLMANTKDVFMNRLDENEHTGPYYLSIQRGIKEEVIIDILRIIKSHGFDLNYKSSTNRGENKPQYPIEYFLNAMVRRKKVIRFLLDEGVNLSLPSSKDPKKTIYQYIMSSPNTEIKKMISNEE